MISINKQIRNILAQEWYGVNSSSSQNPTTMKAIRWACPVSFPSISPLLLSTGMRLGSPTRHLGSGPSSTPPQKSLAASENPFQAIFCDSFPVSHGGTPSCLLLSPHHRDCLPPCQMGILSKHTPSQTLLASLFSLSTYNCHSLAFWFLSHIYSERKPSFLSPSSTLKHTWS